MKSCAIILSLIFSYSMIFAQWMEQSSGTAHDLNDVIFMSEQLGYAVGQNGTFVKTMDGGINWISMEVPSTQDLNSVHFVDSQSGFIGGTAGFLAKTKDGAQTWEIIELDLQGSLELYFQNEELGFIGTADMIYRTIDGGNTWEESLLDGINSFNQIYEIEFISNQKGYALNSLGILKTLDGGLSWTQLIDDSHPDYNGANILTSCEIINENIAYFGSYYYVGLYSTENGSENLNFQELYIHSLDFTSTNTGFAVNGISGLEIIKTEDSGNTWIKIYEHESSRISKIHMNSDEIGWAVGEDGLILHTINGGISTSTNGEIPRISGNQLTLYPNPTSSKITIATTLGTGKMASVEMHSALGEKNLEIMNVQEGFVEISVADFPSGVYFISVQIENGSLLNQRVVIN